jgi:hypothetical protein
VSRLAITNLSFFDLLDADKSKLKGSGALVSFPSTALDTDLDSMLLTGYTNTGDLENGFNIQTLTLGSGAGAAASAVSIFGQATADADAVV